MAKQSTNPQYYLATNSTIASGGSGYAVNDTLALSGGTFAVAATLRVFTVASGVITGFGITNAGNYSVLPTGIVTLTTLTGVGSNATLNAIWVASNPGFTAIEHYGSNTAGVRPAFGTLANCELFINTTDRAIVAGDASGNPIEIVSETIVADTAIVFAIALG